MDLQHDLFEDLPSPETQDRPSPSLAPLAVPCAWRNRRNEPCQRLAHLPLNLDGQQMHAEGRPLLRCDIACFDGHRPNTLNPTIAPDPMSRRPNMMADTLRLAGIVEPSPRGPLLRVEDGTIWRLISEEALDHLLGHAVTIEGVLQGTAIDVYYVGPVSGARQRAAAHSNSALSSEPRATSLR